MSKGGKKLLKAIKASIEDIRAGRYIVHNIIAKDLRTPKYKLRVIEGGKKYKRKDRNVVDIDE